MTTTAELQRRTLRVLVVAQVLSGAGLAAGITVGALLAQDMLGSTEPGRAPQRPVHRGQRSRRGGRRPDLAVARAAARPRHRLRRGRGGQRGRGASRQCSTARCCCSSRCSSTARAAPPTSRRGTPAPTSPTRATAPAPISTVLVATTLGGVVGPLLAAPTGHLAHMVGVPAAGRAVHPGQRRVRRRGGRPRDEAAPRPAAPRARAGGGRGGRGGRGPRSGAASGRLPRSATASSSAPS